MKEQYTLEEVRELLNTKKIGRNKDKDVSLGIVIFVIITNIIVLYSSFYITLKTGIEPSTGLTVWFGFATAEVWALAFIKTRKNKPRKKSESEGEI